MPSIGLLRRLLMPLRGIDAAAIDRACRLADAKGVEVTVRELEALHRAKLDPSAVVQAKAELGDRPRVSIAHLARMALAGQDLGRVVHAFRDQPGLDPERWLIAQVGPGKAVLADQRALGISTARERSGRRWLRLAALMVIAIAIVLGVRGWMRALKGRIDRRHDQIEAQQRAADGESGDDAPAPAPPAGDGPKEAGSGRQGADGGVKAQRLAPSA